MSLKDAAVAFGGLYIVTNITSGLIWVSDFRYKDLTNGVTI